MINFKLLLFRTKSIITVQALEDDTVRKCSANYINSHVSSVDKKIEFYEESGHLILWSKASEKVIMGVGDFLNRVRR